MYRKVFLAGATGAIGSRLAPLLREANYEVFGTTRSESKTAELHADGPFAAVVDGITALERLTLKSPPLEGVVLRYGQIYGPATGFDEATGWAPLHVDAAAHAALLAVQTAGTGIFNIAEDTGYVSIAKARRELGWDPGFRLDTQQPEQAAAFHAQFSEELCQLAKSRKISAWPGRKTTATRKR